jgi:hypothetical protein
MTAPKNTEVSALEALEAITRRLDAIETSLGKMKPSTRAALADATHRPARARALAREAWLRANPPGDAIVLEYRGPQPTITLRAIVSRANGPSAVDSLYNPTTGHSLSQSSVLCASIMLAQGGRAVVRKNDLALRRVDPEFARMLAEGTLVATPASDAEALELHLAKHRNEVDDAIAEAVAAA